MNRSLALVLLSLCTQFGFATQEVNTPRVKVIFDTPSQQAYAERVTSEVEGALDKLIPLFGFQPPPITIRLENASDIYNALASPLPRRNIGVQLLFPTETALGYRAESDLGLLLTHELTHIMQFAFLEGRNHWPKLGLVGENVANVPPAWLVEGLAVWAESEFTTGGRRNDALTRGVLGSAALSGTWPALPAVSLATYGVWPGAQAKYLFGVGFTNYLIRKHGFKAIKAALTQHNAAGFIRPFSASWQLAIGTDLTAEWRGWQRTVAVDARIRATLARRKERAGIQKTQTGWYTRAPALSPDGTRLAWVGWPAAITLADVQAGELHNVRVLLEDRLPGTLEWLDAATLLYARPVPRPGHTYSELFTLDTRTGREAQLTRGARATLPAPLPKGCILYVSDDGTNSSLKQLCPAQSEATTRWRTAAGTHIVGLTTSRRGQVALSLWQRGFVDLALLEGDTLRYLTRDLAQDLEPTWRGEQALLFRSDRDPQGVFELYALATAAPERLSSLTRTLGGAFMPEVGERGVWFTTLGEHGYNLAWLPNQLPLETYQIELRPPKVLTTNPVPALPVRPYRPLLSLKPYGWLPTGGGVKLSPFGLSAEASVLAQDDSADHHARLTLGVDTSRVALLGIYGYARYDYGSGGLPLRAIPRPLRFSFQAGSWPLVPHLTQAHETAAGVQVGVTARLPHDTLQLSLEVEASLIHLLGQPGGLQFDARSEGTVSTMRRDPWGYRSKGWRGALNGVWSATGMLPSLGAWAEGSYVLPVGGVGQLEFGIRAGYRPAWQIPLTVHTDLAALASVGLTRSFPVELRYGDGLYALERVTLEPRLHTWVDNAVHLGGDLTVSFDSVVSYSAPVSFSGTLGYANSWWYRVGVRLPL